MNRAKPNIAAGALALVVIAATTTPAVLPPRVYQERIRDSKIKALAVVESAEKLAEKRGVIDLKVTFRAAKSFGARSVTGSFIGFCKAFNPKSGHTPMAGPTIYLDPKVGQTVYVTVSDLKGRITSLTRATPRLMEALIRRPETVQPGMASVRVVDGSDALLKRASELAGKGDYVAALAEAKKAVAVNDSYPEAWAAVGQLEERRGRYAEAVKAYTKAIECGVRPVEAYARRGRCYLDMGDSKRAMADIRQAIALDPKASILYDLLGVAIYESARKAEDYVPAADEFRRAIEVDPKDRYAPIFLFLSLARAGRDGRPALREALGRSKTSEWPAPAMKMFLGQISPEQCLAAAEYNDDVRRGEQMCEANYYAGMFYLLKGEDYRAAGRFMNCLEQGIFDYVEHRLAKVELSRLLRGLKRKGAAAPGKPKAPEDPLQAHVQALLDTKGDLKAFSAKVDEVAKSGKPESVTVLTRVMLDLPWPKGESNPGRAPKFVVARRLDQLVASSEHDTLCAAYFRALDGEGDLAKAKAALLQWTQENLPKMKWDGGRFVPQK